MASFPGTAGYAALTERFIHRKLPFSLVHEPYLDLLPEPPARVIDIGAGPGHDAAHLSGLGHDVVAVEPTDALFQAARSLYADTPVRWIADGLPALERVSGAFALVVMSGVWMHLDEGERRVGMARVASLVAPGGLLALSLRHGPVPAGRRMFPVSAEETISLAAAAGLRLVRQVERASVQAANRAAGVTWTHLAFRRGLPAPGAAVGADV